MVHILWASLAIPIIIHMVYRRKAKPLPFSTLYFLCLVDQRVHRRYRLKELLLLALRLLLLAALVGAFLARRHGAPLPALKAGHIPTTVAIVLDNTYSMRLVDRGSTAFARARQAALDILDGLSGEDAVVLVLLDSRQTAPLPPTTARADLRAALDKMEPGYGTGELSTPLKRALKSLKLSINERKEIYVVTDMQKLCWTGGLEAVSKEIPPKVPVFLVDVGTDAKQNLTLAGADFGRRITAGGTVASLYCEVQNTASRNAVLELSMFLGDSKIQQQQVGLAAGGKRTVVFHHLFDRLGQYTGRVELSQDDLPADNAWFYAVDVKEKVPVLVVNGDPSIIPYRDGAFYLRLALEARSRTGELLSPIRPKIVTDRELVAERLEDYACVILANVARLEQEAAQKLTAHVRAGGGLLIFCGDKVDPASYNVAIGPSALPPAEVVRGPGEEPAAATPDAERNPLELLPGKLGRVQLARSEQDAFFHVTNVNARHPILQDIVEEITLKTTQVRQFISLEAGPTEEGTNPYVVELDGGPLLAERRVGAGTVLVCTTSCTPDWSNLPLKPYFLPILHRIIYYAAGPEAQESSATVGMAYRLRIPETRGTVNVSFFPPPTPEQLAKGQEPVPHQVQSKPIGGENSAIFDKTDLPGVYRAEIALGPSVRRVHYFAVNVPVRESNLERLPIGEAAKELGTPDVVAVRNPDELRAIVQRAREGLPLWDFLLALAIIVAACESYVANVALKHG